jgi:hypothetical protein
MTTLTPAQESTRRLLLAGTAIATRIREAQSDFMMEPGDMLTALGAAAGELVAEQACQAGILSLAMPYEETFIDLFREAFRARVRVIGIGRVE